MLSSTLNAAEGRSVVALSDSTELQPNTRTAVLLAPRLFRLDVVIHADTLRTVVRNLSNGELEMRGEIARYTAETVETDPGAAAYRPSATTVEFSLGDEHHQIEVKMLLGVLYFQELGCHRVSVQAILRQSPL